jgi:hydrogenase 3 maturation protease
MTIDKESLKPLRTIGGKKTVILGMGNILKGDDCVGPFICDELSKKALTADIINTGTVPENYIQRIIKKEPDALIVIDAIEFDGEAGEIRLLRPEQLNKNAFSTHTLSPHLFIEMVQQSKKVDVYVIGIQPKQIKLGEGITKEVRQSAEEVVSELTEIFTIETKSQADES